MIAKFARAAARAAILPTADPSLRLKLLPDEERPQHAVDESVAQCARAERRSRREPDSSIPPCHTHPQRRKPHYVGAVILFDRFIPGLAEGDSVPRRAQRFRKIETECKRRLPSSNSNIRDTGSEDPYNHCFLGIRWLRAPSSI